MARPYTRHRDHAAMAGPATRATTDAILARLHEESAHASMLHEEIPDWVDIERRPTPRPAPRPVPTKPKEKAAVMRPETKPETPKPKRGKPRPKTDLEEPARAEVAAALKRVGRGPCSVSAELFRHTGMSNWLRTGKGLGPENVAKALEWARSVPAKPEEARGSGFEPEPYPETTTKGGGLNQPPLPPPSRQKLCQWCYAWTNPGERCACPRVNPEPDPAAYVLETWAASRLTYAMETLGLTMPEGYRFRVSVERA